MRSVTSSVTILLSAFLAGCCAFVPCHPGTWVFGTVSVAQSSSPVSGATISLFNSKLVSSSSGCFKVHLSSAYPLTFSVSAPGYKRVEVPAKFGFYKLAVALAPEQSSESSSVEWHETSESEFHNASPCL